MGKDRRNYEQVLGDVAAYIAVEYGFLPSEAVGIVMNAEGIEGVIKNIEDSTCQIDVSSLAEKIMHDVPMK